MRRNALIIVAVLFTMIVAIGAIVIESALHDSTETLIGFLAVTVVPSVTSLLAYHESGKASRNTNGLLHEQMRRADAAERLLKQLTQKDHDHDDPNY